MKLRLLGVLLAATGLGGCASYDYAGGSGTGGYYHGRASVDHYYGGYGSYGTYGTYGGYGPYGTYGRYAPYAYGHPGYGIRYYGSYGYSPYYRNYLYPRYHVVRPPQDHRRDDHGHGHGHGPGEDRRGNRPPPWRVPDGRYHDSGQMLVPERRQTMPGSVAPPGGLSMPDRPGARAPRAVAVPRQPAPSRQRESRVLHSEPRAAREDRDVGLSRELD